MLGQLRIRAVQLRVIQISAFHPGGQVVRHDPFRDTADEPERLHMRLGPRPLVHPQHRPHEHVPRVRQHHCAGAVTTYDLCAGISRSQAARVSAVRSGSTSTGW
ncbi:hypothetical protein Psuf_021910 [Phytohabitans suffuscus]|uniref:Uncharacterized protein n=1 Tax=Phytohabitans suffuscus TaxID=624315 RepID=A0A6F8YFX4_9ACTN|nr:hypothetical protein Psuf_021910 [Phytohabitans suffuscus]